jgi:hypothetical protein|tara:strand:+ start:355 stop:582 length:228 start_codon:yes stop_codon:yes gene_type:complete
MFYHQIMENEKTETENEQIIPHSEVVAYMNHHNLEMALKSPEDKAKYLVRMTNLFQEVYSKINTASHDSDSHERD